MGYIGLALVLGVASIIATSYGQCIRIRSGNGQPPCSQPPSCSCSSSCTPCGTSVEDLTTLLAIVRALEEKEAPKSSINNAEEIILQLVNALVYATTQNSGCNKVCGGSIPPSGGIPGGNTGATVPGGIPIPPKVNPDNSLITLDLLQPDSTSNPEYDNILRLGVSGINLLEVGVGSQDEGTVSDTVN